MRRFIPLSLPHKQSCDHAVALLLIEGCVSRLLLLLTACFDNLLTNMLIHAMYTISYMALTDSLGLNGVPSVDLRPCDAAVQGQAVSDRGPVERHPVL